MNNLKSPAVLLSLACLVGLVILFTAREIVQVDPFFHIAAGRQILSHGLPYQNVFLQFHSDFPVTNHEWLYQIVITTLFSLGGFPILNLLKTVFVSAILVAISLSLPARNRLAPIFLALLLLLVGFPRFILRPELFSFAALLLNLWLCEKLRKSGSKRTLIQIFVLQLLWVNIHGLWILGLGTTLCYLAEAHLPASLRSLGLRTRRQHKNSQLQAFLLVAAASVITPYTWRSVLYPFSKIFSASAEQQRILELQNPLAGLSNGSIDSLGLLSLGLLAGIGLIFQFRRRQVRLSWLLIALGLTTFGLKTTRTLPFVAVSLLPLALEPLRLLKSTKTQQITLLTVLLVITGFTSFHAAKGHYHKSPLFHARLGLDRHPVFDYPNLDKFLENQGQQPYLNNFSAGHVLLFQRSTSDKQLAKPYICANTDLYSAEFYDQYWLAANGLGLAPLLDKHNLTAAFVDHRTSPQLMIALSKLAGWSLSNINHSYAVFVRTTPNRTLPTPLENLRNQLNTDKTKLFHPAPEIRAYQILHLSTALELLGQETAYQIAESLLEDLSKLRPDWYTVRELKARLTAAQGFKAESDQIYDQLATDYPDNPQIQLSAANSALTSNRLDVAKARFQHARDLGALPEAVDRGLAQTLLSSRDMINLRRHIHNSSLKPEWKAFFNGRAAAAEKSYKRAQKFYYQALDARPDLHIARYYLAELLYHMRRYKLAAGHFETLLQQQPRDADALEYYGATLFQLKKHDQAVAAWKRATELSPRRANLWFNLARAQFQIKNYKEAKLANQRCLKLVKVFRQRTKIHGSVQASLDKLEKNAMVLKAQLDRRPDAQQNADNQ